MLIADRLARAGGAGDQQMRHLGEVDDDRLAVDVLPSASASFALVASNPGWPAFRADTPSRAWRWAVRCRWRCGRERRRRGQAIALIERAMSSARPITRDDLMPGAGSSSYRVTTGPGRTWMISPLTPKSSSTLSSRRAFCSSASFDRLGSRATLLGSERKCSDGISNLVGADQRGLRLSLHAIAGLGRGAGFSTPGRTGWRERKFCTCAGRAPRPLRPEDSSGVDSASSSNSASGMLGPVQRPSGRRIRARRAHALQR